jgi:hypothetical protein
MGEERKVYMDCLGVWIGFDWLRIGTGDELL